MSEGTKVKKPSAGKHLARLFGFIVVLLVGAALLYSSAFGPVDKNAQTEQFLIPPDQTLTETAEDLTAKGFVRDPLIFQIAFMSRSDGHNIRPGGYEISKSMDALTIASQLVAPPYAAWVKVPVGVRKEQIGEILAEALDWTPQQIAEWSNVNAGANYQEGVFLPDTYFIPTDMPPAVVAQMMIDRFKVAFAPYADEAAARNIPWTKVVTIASLIQREAGGADDMPIISGIIQKRLAVGMPLAIDATLQYMNGNTDDGWWVAPDPAGTYPDSPFNTYKRKGLPPHPIAEPSLTAIEAALNPISTDCLFYIHDNKGNIHCSPSYKQHLANINKYLK